MTVYNLGSINIDMVLRVPHLPLPGETLAGLGSETDLGGKGANQSVAAARAGATVRHIGMIGSDGGPMRDAMAGYGVDVTHVGVSAEPTGRAVVMVEPGGENSIVILSGSNRAQSAAAIHDALAGAVPEDTLVLQNETSEQVTAARAAHERGLRVVCSAAPFEVDAVRAVLPFVSVLLVNEVEAAQLVDALGVPLTGLPVGYVVVTRGAAGAVLIDTGEGRETPYPTLKVEPVDTTGAGDTFAGYLAAGLDRGETWDEAMPVALAAAALSTTKPGAAPAIPALADVRAAMGRP